VTALGTPKKSHGPSLRRHPTSWMLSKGIFVHCLRKNMVRLDEDIRREERS
jgi:hypothetical protein